MSCNFHANIPSKLPFCSHVQLNRKICTNQCRSSPIFFCQFCVLTFYRCKTFIQHHHYASSHYRSHLPIGDWVQKKHYSNTAEHKHCSFIPVEQKSSKSVWSRVFAPGLPRWDTSDKTHRLHTVLRRTPTDRLILKEKTVCVRVCVCVLHQSNKTGEGKFGNARWSGQQ